MTFSFEKKVVNNGEYTVYNFEHPQFIGYLNPYGQVINYSEPLGIGGHNNNKLTSFFEQNFRMPSNDPWIQEIDKKNVINLEEEQMIAEKKRKFFKERIEHNAYLRKKNSLSRDPDIIFSNDLDEFFYHCYQADTFMEGFGQNCMSLNISEFNQKFCEQKKLYQKELTETEEQYHKRYHHLLEYDYYWYKKKLMLDWYKTVIVQYMHYHLIERCKKGITTSSLKVYETFYNYLINGFTIHQIPYMIYDDTLKTHIVYEQNPFLISDNELRLKDEIQSIKELVPNNELTKYYR